MVLQQRDKTLSDHARAAQNGYTQLLTHNSPPPRAFQRIIEAALQPRRQIIYDLPFPPLRFSAHHFFTICSGTPALSV
jgi:hypothetical protein